MAAGLRELSQSRPPPRLTIAIEPTAAIADVSRAYGAA